MLFCGHQNIALRGHRESGDSHNPGDFRALLTFLTDSGFNVLKEHFLTAPRNAQYTSHMIQNDLIALSGKYIQKALLNEIQAGSNLIDTHSTIQEAFLAFVECEYGTSGEQLAALM